MTKKNALVSSPPSLFWDIISSLLPCSVAPRAIERFPEICLEKKFKKILKKSNSVRKDWT